MGLFYSFSYKFQQLISSCLVRSASALVISILASRWFWEVASLLGSSIFLLAFLILRFYCGGFPGYHHLILSHPPCFLLSTTSLLFLQSLHLPLTWYYHLSFFVTLSPSSLFSWALTTLVFSSAVLPYFCCRFLAVAGIEFVIVGTVVENIGYFGSFGHFVGCLILAFLHSTCFVAGSSN